MEEVFCYRKSTSDEKKRFGKPEYNCYQIFIQTYQMEHVKLKRECAVSLETTLGANWVSCCSLPPLSELCFRYYVGTHVRLKMIYRLIERNADFELIN